MPLTGRVETSRADDSALYQRYDSRPRSLATVQNRNAQAATIVQKPRPGPLLPRRV